jgi:ABC-type multidrug transport system ATPase subunit
MPILPPGDAPARSGSDLAIEVENLVKVYPGGATGLAGVSLGIPRAEIFGLLGPNGAGKTTAVRILVTLLHQTSGSARVGGFDTRREAHRVRGVIGYAGQFVGVDDDLTVHENLVLQGLLHGLPPNGRSARRLTEVAESLGLAEVEGRRAGRLSGGLRRRLDLAQALVHRPAILFLDEPTTGLDPQSRHALWRQLRQLSSAGTTVVLTTQYLEEADRVCDRVAILDGGRLVVVGPPASLKQAVGGGRLTVTIGDPGGRARAVRVLASCPAVARVEHREPDRSLRVHVADPGADLVQVLHVLDTAGVRVASVEPSRASLDDVFLHYTGERPRVESRVTGGVSGIFGAAHRRRAGRGTA